MANYYQIKYCPTCKKNVTPDKGEKCKKCGTKVERSSWCVMFRDKNGKQIKKQGFKTKRLAEEAYYKYMNGLNDDLSPEITVGKLFERYKQFIATRLKPSSVKSSCDVIRLYVLPTFENTKLKKISVKDIEDWQKDIISKGFKYKYKSKIYCGFTALINYAIKHGLIDYNVVAKVGNFINNEPRKEMLYWTESEFISFYKEIENDIEYKTFFAFLYFTGCRKGEALALTWEDVDLNTKFVNISKSINRQGLTGVTYQVTTPKNKASYRRILMPDKLNEIMKAYKDWCKFSECYKENIFVFGGAKPFSEQTIRRRMDFYADKAKIKHIRVHDLRHSHASLLINKGQNILIVSQRLGHSDITQTLNTYSHLMPDKQQEIINALNIDI